MSPFCKTGMAVAIVLNLYISPAFSQEITNESQSNETLSVGIGFPDNSKPLRARAGIGVGVFPDYEGSEDYSAKVSPLIHIEKPGVFFIKGASINTNDGVASAGLTLFHLTYADGSTAETQLLVGPLVRAYRGRDDDDNDILNGMADIDSSAGVGIFMKLNSGSWLFNLAAASQDVGNKNDGLLVTFDAVYTTSINKNLKLASGLSTSWGDDDYMQGYFGVTSNQAANTGLAQFDSKAGIKDVGINIKATYALSKNWILDGQVGYWRLLNDTADNPLVDKEGSENQVRGLVGLSYQF